MKNTVDEALDIAARRKLGQRMKRTAKRMARIRKRHEKRQAGKEKIEKRSKKAAIKAIKDKLTKGRTAQLSPQQKIGLEKKLAKRKPFIARLAKKLLPKTRAKEKERLKRVRSRGKQESVSEPNIINTINELSKD